MRNRSELLRRTGNPVHRLVCLLDMPEVCSKLVFLSSPFFGLSWFIVELLFRVVFVFIFIMRRGRFFLSVLLGFLIILVLLWLVGFREVLVQILGLDFRWFIVLFLLQVVLMFFWGLKWWVILGRYNLPLRRVLPVSFFGYFMNNVTPIALAGGEPLRAYVLSKTEDVSFEDAAASVIMDVYVEVFPLLFAIILSVFFVASYGVGDVLILLLFAAFCFISCVLLFIVMLAVNERMAETMVSWFVRLVSYIPVGVVKNQALTAKSRLDEVIVNFRSAMKTTLDDRKTIFWGTVVSFFIWILHFARVYVVFWMLGFKLTFPVLVVTRVTVLAVSFLSFIPGALGFWEGTTTYVFSFFGISAATAMAAVLVERFFSYFIANLIGFAAASYLGYNKLVDRYEG